MSTFPASDPTPHSDRGVVTFTARGEQLLDEMARRLVGDCDGTLEGIASLLEQVLSSKVADLTEVMEAPAAAGQRERRELVDQIDVDDTTPGETLDEAAPPRLGARARDDVTAMTSTPREAPGPIR